jgi:hypothetical protein
LSLRSGEMRGGSGRSFASIKRKFVRVGSALNSVSCWPRDERESAESAESAENCECRALLVALAVEACRGEAVARAAPQHLEVDCAELAEERRDGWFERMIGSF